MRPSSTSPSKAGFVQYDASTGTTSVWLQSIIGRLPPSPGSVASRMSRSGCGSRYVQSKPSAASRSPRKCAAGASRPGGFDVSMRRYRVSTSSASACTAAQSISGISFPKPLASRRTLPDVGVRGCGSGFGLL